MPLRKTHIGVAAVKRFREVGDPNWATVAVMLHFDATDSPSDGSTNLIDYAGGTWECLGSSSLKTAAARFGETSAGGFNGSGSYIRQFESPATYEHAQYDFAASTPFTWEGWFYLNARITSTRQFLFGKIASGNDSGANYEWGVFLQTERTVRFTTGSAEHRRATMTSHFART
jgi:hypothetical protein